MYQQVFSRECTLTKECLDICYDKQDKNTEEEIN